MRPEALTMCHGGQAISGLRSQNEPSAPARKKSDSIYLSKKVKLPWVNERQAPKVRSLPFLRFGVLFIRSRLSLRNKLDLIGLGILVLTLYLRHRPPVAYLLDYRICIYT